MAGKEISAPHPGSQETSIAWHGREAPRPRWGAGLVVGGCSFPAVSKRLSSLVPHLTPQLPPGRSPRGLGLPNRPGPEVKGLQLSLLHTSLGPGLDGPHAGESGARGPVAQEG